MKKVYSAQALAIVMIVLVIAAILGMAMLSRTLRDTQQLANEKSSAEALEFADSVLDTMKGTTVATLVNACDNAQYGEGLKSADGCNVKGVSDVKAFLTSAGVDNNTLDVFDKCQNSSSNVELSAKLADSDDELELRSDNVRSFVVREQTPNPLSCTLNLKFEPRGSSYGGLIISRIYARNYTNGIPGEYKPYEYDDIQQYCVHLTGKLCADNSSMDGSWIDLASGATVSVPLAAKGGYPLDEIRVRSVGGTVAIKASLSDPDCIKDWEMVAIRIGANCTGTFRAKEIQIPQKESALSIFDYVLFNSEGVLGPE
ncbi:MAG: hypothetical protein UT34_C0001G0258 [candidate division WS6 bacterium GW2011_GWF2_39_15]|uniref:Uncharacterized protein n=1 Tax=candidate division WS6 bacterium GW2011_GWF2_39_15 TaxID=1619100 RepID=A0A0G0MSV2_9BACT|nr:MAG: hypothetical protein UT34_C0001G0258 [candidate division WS6 bacterium GW2011_GWF2_39_15]